MIDGVFVAVLVAAVAGLLVTPLALVEIVRIGRRNRQLAERNAVQAALLAERAYRPLRDDPTSCALAREGGWIVTSADGLRFRMWETGFPRWTDRRSDATRYARRVDAEAVHAEDEDAWRVIPFNEGRAERRAAVEAGYADLSSYVADYGNSD